MKSMHRSIGLSSLTQMSRYILGCVLLSGTFSIGMAAPSGETLRKGVFLIATENLNSSSFQKTVILVTDYGAQGTVGVAINRPAQMPLSQAFPDLKKFSTDYPLYLGGPVHAAALLVLTRSSPGDGMLHVFDDIYFSGGRAAYQHLSRAFKNRTEGETRAYAGYTGWAPAQLENEIQRGDWLVVKAAAEPIFKMDPQTIWSSLFKAEAGHWI